MADQSKIEWTNATWSPVRGCSMVSAGCTNCYAMRTHHRWQHLFGKLTKSGPHGMVWTGQVRTFYEKLFEPLTWREPRLIFVNSQSDSFHEDVPEQFITDMFGIMFLTPWHTYQVLTKRPERARDYLRAGDHGILAQYDAIMRGGGVSRRAVFAALDQRRRDGYKMEWPLPNVWIGTSVEDQEAADERIPVLLETPAATRFLSCEPLLGPVDLRRIRRAERLTLDALTGAHTGESTITTFAEGLDKARRGELDLPTLPGRLPGIDWVIVGGESGPRARPMNLTWTESIISQCADAKVACFVKQLGSRPYQTRPAEGRPQGAEHALATLGAAHPQRPWFPGWTLVHEGERSSWIRYPKLVHKKGGDPQEWPEEFRVRQFPNTQEIAF